MSKPFAHELVPYVVPSDADDHTVARAKNRIIVLRDQFLPGSALYDLANEACKALDKIRIVT